VVVASESGGFDTDFLIEFRLEGAIFFTALFELRRVGDLDGFERFGGVGKGL
jgi:hypothetical protein